MDLLKISIGIGISAAVAGFVYALEIRPGSYDKEQPVLKFDAPC